MCVRPYLFLLLAALFEVGWPLGFRLSVSSPEHRVLLLILSALSMAVSGFFLYLAQRTIPVSTAYIVWTGAGAVGTFLIGLLLFGDSASSLRVMSAVLVVAGIVGLELFG